MKKIVLFMLIISSISYGKLEKQFGFEKPQIHEGKNLRSTIIGSSKDIGAVLYFEKIHKYTSNYSMSKFWESLFEGQKIIYFEENKIVCISEQNEIMFLLKKKYEVNLYSYTTEKGFKDLINYLRANKNDDYKKLEFLKLKTDLYKLSEYSDKLNKI